LPVIADFLFPRRRGLREIHSVMETFAAIGRRRVRPALFVL
jgi:hypothetical protein